MQIIQLTSLTLLSFVSGIRLGNDPYSQGYNYAPYSGYDYAAQPGYHYTSYPGYNYQAQSGYPSHQPKSKANRKYDTGIREGVRYHWDNLHDTIHDKRQDWRREKDSWWVKLGSHARAAEARHRSNNYNYRY